MKMALNICMADCLELVGLVQPKPVGDRLGPLEMEEGVRWPVEVEVDVPGALQPKLV